MISQLVRTSLTLVVLNLLFSPASALWNSNSDYGNHNQGYYDLGYPKTLSGTTAGLPSQAVTRRGLGISAWGIVFLVVGLILVGMAVYYFTICYEICRPSKKNYDKMGMPSMA